MQEFKDTLTWTGFGVFIGLVVLFFMVHSRAQPINNATILRLEDTPSIMLTPYTPSIMLTPYIPYRGEAPPLVDYSVRDCGDTSEIRYLHINLINRKKLKTPIKIYCQFGNEDTLSVCGEIK